MNATNCVNCRTPMVQGPTGGLRCPQCGFQSAITSPVGTYGPPPTWAAPQQKSSSSLGWIIGILALVLLVPACIGGLVLVGSIAAFTAAPMPVVPSAPIAPTPMPGMPPPIVAPSAPVVDEPPAPPPLHIESRICVLNDLDGDGAGEIGALVSQGRDRQRRPAILLGSTGAPHWIGEPLTASRETRLLCAGLDWLMVLDQQAFELRMHPITSPDGVLVRALTDEVDRYGVTDRCIALRLEDGGRPSFSLETGTPSSCSASYGLRPHISDSTTCGIISMNRRGRTVTAGDVNYQIHVRARGTALLQVTARRRNRELWDRPLDLVPVGGTAIGCFAGAAFPGTAVVLGSERDSSHAAGLFAVGLAEDTGIERYRVDLGGSRVRDVVANGRFVVVTVSNRMLAIEPSTGEIAWSL